MSSTAARANDPASPSDRRRHSRQPSRSLAYVEIDDGNGGIVLNVSEGGLAVQAVMTLTEEMFPHVRFQLARSKDWIETGARIAWANESRKVAGLQFVDLPELSRARLREWLSVRNSPATVVKAPQEQGASSERSQGPASSSRTIAGPPAIIAPPKAPATPAPVYMFGRILNESPDSGKQRPESASHRASSSSRMWILAGLFLFLAIVSLGAGWVTGLGSFGEFFSRIRGLRTSSPQQQSVMPPGRPAVPVSEIEIVDANSETRVIPFVPPGSGIEKNPAPVNAPTQALGRRAVEPPTRLSHRESISPPAATGSRIEVLPTEPVPPTGVPQAGPLQRGEIVRRVDPVYPEGAPGHQMEGTVKLRVRIGEDGSVRSVMATSGPVPLVEAAKAAVRQWRYSPTLLGGKPVEAEEDVSIVFQLLPTSR
jgi:periplasmic protein TonB